MYREFIVPDDQEILEAIGEWPETEEDGEARFLSLQSEEQGVIRLSYQPTARSVRVRWLDRNGEEIVDLFREGATLMTVHSGANSAAISLEFQMGECAGVMEIQVLPKFAFKDHLLFV
ncbi:hypothetical protein ACWC2T_18005 [Streptomyces sp. NPDC001393]